MRHEAPIIAHRIRKAALAGASVSIASSEKSDYFFDVANYLGGPSHPARNCLAIRGEKGQGGGEVFLGRNNFES